MLTLKLITEETERVVRGLEKKHFKDAKKAIDEVLAVDKRRREAQRRRAGRRVRRRSAAQDGVRQHLHLRIHRDKGQNGQMVVRAKTHADVVKLFHRAQLYQIGHENAETFSDTK